MRLRGLIDEIMDTSTVSYELPITDRQNFVEGLDDFSGLFGDAQKRQLGRTNFLKVVRVQNVNVSELQN